MKATETTATCDARIEGLKPDHSLWIICINSFDLPPIWFIWLVRLITRVKSVFTRKME